MVLAEKDSNPYPWGENPNNKLKMYWNDARNVLQDLDDSFSALYIQYHGCVWSECSVDNYDDDGENRDGDEYWYQYRTQPFCANAAYSLYGVLKDAITPVLPWDHCSRSTYINSFFTYGGADTLLEPYNDLAALATTILDDYNNGHGGGNNNGNNKNNNNYYGSGGGSHPNAVCYAQGGNNNNNNNNKNNNNNNNGGDNGYSMTMGCSADGKQFVAALFTGQVCEGHNFQETIHTMDEYNTVMARNFKCRQIYSRRKDGAAVRSYYQALQAKQQAANNNNNNKNGGHFRRELPQEDMTTTSTSTEEDEEEETKPTSEAQPTSDNEDPSSTLLRGSTSSVVVDEQQPRQLGNNNNNNNNYNNDDGIAVPDIPAWTILAQSWACDVSLYPNGMCPDPYHLKRRYDAVMTATARGRPGGLARFHYRIARYLRLGSILALMGGIILYVSSYWVSRREMCKKVGCCTTVCGDVKDLCVGLGKFLRKCCRACVSVVTGKTRRQRRAAAAAASADQDERPRSRRNSSSRSVASSSGKSSSRSKTRSSSSSGKKTKKRSSSSDQNNTEKSSSSRQRSKSSSSPRKSSSSKSRSSRSSRKGKRSSKDDTSHDYFAFF